MNYRLIFRLIGNLLSITAIFLLLPLIVSLIYGERFLYFVIPIMITIAIAIPLSRIKPEKKRFHLKEGFVAVSLAWLVISLIGALPYLFSGFFNSFADCFFESMSGFTTTGATVLSDIEALPKGILFWRGFSHWIGGMGVLVFAIILLPGINASSVNLLRAEGTGPAAGKIVPKIRETAKIMYIIYISMTLIVIFLLAIAGMPLFDSIVNAFSVAGTGGFATKTASIGYFDNLAIEIIVTVFVLLFGVNFSLYYNLFKRDIKSLKNDEELRLYLIIVAVSTIIITINITGRVYPSVGEAIRHATFQVATVITTAGFSTSDYDLWPPLSKAVLVMIMFTGASAGSTGGGVKIIRILILLKAAKNEIHQIIHPRIVKTVKVNGKKTDDKLISKIALFIFIYLVILISCTLLLSIEGHDLTTNLSAAMAMISNIGPGFQLVGPTNNYSIFSPFAKILLSFCMLAGRLEFYPVFVMFIPTIWRKGALN